MFRFFILTLSYEEFSQNEMNNSDYDLNTDFDINLIYLSRYHSLLWDTVEEKL